MSYAINRGFMPFKWVHDKAGNRHHCIMWAKDKAGNRYKVWATIRVEADCVPGKCDWQWIVIANNANSEVHARDDGYAETAALAKQQADIALAALIKSL